MTPRQNGSRDVDDPPDLRPRRRARLRLQLPPVRPDADLVQPVEHDRHGVAAKSPCLPAMISSSNSRPTFGESLEGRQQHALLLGLQLRRVVGVVEAQAFDRVRHRPFHQLAAEILVTVEAQRPRALNWT